MSGEPEQQLTAEEAKALIEDMKVVRHNSHPLSTGLAKLSLIAKDPALSVLARVDAAPEKAQPRGARR